MEVGLDSKKLILGWDEKNVVRENKLKTFYLNFTKNNKIIQTTHVRNL